MSDSSQLHKVAQRANRMLNVLTEQVQLQKDELHANEFYQVYAKAALAKLPLLTRANVDYAVSEMEEKGYVFDKRPAGSSMKYAMSIQNIIDIYEHRGVPKYRDRYSEAYVIFISNLKGGVSKTVSTVSLAHAMRAHPHLLMEDLRILVIDLDPQASSTMFLDHTHSIGTVLETAAQAMLNDLDAETLREAVIRPTIIPGVDIIPASIDDGFVASQWESLVTEHLPGLKPSEVLKKTIIDRIAGDYDFVFIDTGPHLDPFLLNGLAASDLLLTPTPPAQVDFHSTLKYLTRLPEMLERLEEEGVEPRLSASIGFMSKMTGKRDHETSHSLAREVYASNILDASLPRLDGFERCGESFDTIISANPVSYPGSAEALKKARTEAERFTKAVFDRIEYIRGASK